jgi:glycosyltransferase involved in cell wall biosynthesis
LGFDFSNLDITPDMRRENRSCLGIIPDDFVIGIVARLVDVKDHALFLDAAALALKKAPHIKFLIIGDGELKQSLQNKALALGIADRVIFTGWKTDLSEIYSLIDAATLTSKNEGLPVTLIEALAAGIPVASCDVGGVRDIIDHAKTGYVVLDRTAAALADTYIEMSFHREQTRQMGLIGRSITRSRFSHERLINDMDRLYKTLAARHLGKKFIKGNLRCAESAEF